MVNFRGLLRDGFRENYKSEKRGQDIYKLSRVEVPSMLFAANVVPPYSLQARAPRARVAARPRHMSTIGRVLLLLLLHSQPPSSAASLHEAAAEDATAPPTAVSLHEAAAQDDGKLVYKLFAEGSPTDTLDENKMTPLMLASYLGSTPPTPSLRFCIMEQHSRRGSRA